MDLKIWSSVSLQRLRENKWVVDSGLVLVMAWGGAQALLGRRTSAVLVLSQVHRTTRSSFCRRLVEPYIIRNHEAIYREPQSLKSQELKSCFGNRLMVLKAPAPGGEKGVLFAMMSSLFQLIHDGMNVEKLLEDYTLVFEPSWSGCCHPELLEFTRWKKENIFILAAEENDFAFLKHLSSNLVPIDLGPCDWVDPNATAPYLENPKEFDIVMNSNWGAWKRHHVLFRMLKHAKQRYKVLLVGVKWSGKTRKDIERLAEFFGVADQLTIFERIPYEQVMDLTCRSKVSILLSLKEGSNRAIAEGIFCNLPVVVLSNHVGGIRKNVVPETGLLVEERHLESAIDKLLQSHLSPREWGLKHVSCIKSTERLNSILKEWALKNGLPWSQDIAVRSNSPESKYQHEQDAIRLTPWNEALKDYLKL